MKKLIIVFLALACIQLEGNAQTGKKLPNIMLKSVDNSYHLLPDFGKKVLVVIYMDPDIQDMSLPLTDAINNKNYSVTKFAAIGVVNCKDSWIPNSTIKNRIMKKIAQYPKSIILLDENYELKSNWQTGECNDQMVVFIIDKNSSVKYQIKISSVEACKKIIPDVLSSIDALLN